MLLAEVWWKPFKQSMISPMLPPLCSANFFLSRVKHIKWALVSTLGGRQTQTCPAETGLLSEITTPKPKTVPLIRTNSSNAFHIWSSVWLQISGLCLIEVILIFMLLFLNKPALILCPWLSMSLMTSGSTPDMRTEGGEDGWKDARQRTGGDGGSGQIPPSPVCVCGSQAKKRCCSPEGRVSLPESLWHLLQVLVSVGFKLHILNGGQSHKNTPNIMQYVAAKSG